jgi:hypothetical protein
MLRPTGDPLGARITYEIIGRVTFADMGSGGLRLVSMELDLLDASGTFHREAQPIDLTLASGGTVTQALPERVTVPTGRTPLRLRVTATGVDQEGRQRATDPGEGPVAVDVAVTPGPVPAADVTFVGAGDIASCETQGAALTARLLDAIPGEVFTLGDNVYPSGSEGLYATCYHSTWGRHRGRTRPTIGNHDWGEDRAAPYFKYFGAAAGNGTGYYSFDLGAWHILSLNSNSGTGPNSEQFAWVRADLAAHPSRCTLAFWHHPRYSSGLSGNTASMQQLWWLLDGAGVDVVLAAHDHSYERFAPLDHEGQASPTGIRSFVVGTGGGPPSGFHAAQPHSEARGEAWGVLKLTLRAAGYAWSFVPVPGASFRDEGSDVCR